MRKKLGTKLGGQGFVPDNIMPNGQPFSGTTKEDWPEEIKDFLEDHS